MDANIQEKSLPSRENCQCKNPEGAACLACDWSRVSKRRAVDEVREVVGAVFRKDSGFSPTEDNHGAG